MRKLTTFGAVLLAGLALSAMLAGGAYAKSSKPTLILKNDGTPVAKGGPAYAGVFTEECLTSSAGTLSANESKKDKAAFTSSAAEVCFGAASIKGFVTSAQLSTAGAASFKSDITVTLPGTCAYTIKKFTGSFNPNGGEVSMETTATGKAAKGSPKTCAKSDTLTLFVDVGNEESEAFVTELS